MFQNADGDSEQDYDDETNPEQSQSEEIDGSRSPFLGSHVVKTVRNLKIYK